MSGMDRLSDDKLKRMADGLFNALEMQLLDDLGSMARELLAHRRASQAAPAPSDHLVSVGKASGMVEARVSLAARQIRQTLRDYGHRCAETSLPDLIAADVDAALRKQDEVHTPAPSDGLREASDRAEAAAWNDAIEAAAEKCDATEASFIYMANANLPVISPIVARDRARQCAQLAESIRALRRAATP